MVENAGQMIRSARFQAGLSQAQLAKKARTSRSAITRYESLEHQPSLPVLRRILQSAGSDIRFEPNQAQGRKVVEVCEMADVIIQSRSNNFKFEDKPDWPIFKDIVVKHA